MKSELAVINSESETLLERPRRTPERAERCSAACQVRVPEPPEPPRTPEPSPSARAEGRVPGLRSRPPSRPPRTGPGSAWNRGLSPRCTRHRLTRPSSSSAPASGKTQAWKPTKCNGLRAVEEKMASSVCLQSPGWRTSKPSKGRLLLCGRGRAASTAGAACCPERTRPKGEPQVPGGRQAPGLPAPPQEADPSACQPPQEPQTRDLSSELWHHRGRCVRGIQRARPGAVPEATF